MKISKLETKWRCHLSRRQYRQLYDLLLHQKASKKRNNHPLDQIAAFAEISPALGLKVHVVVDRFAKTLDSLNVSSEEKTWNSGIYLPMAAPRKATLLRKPLLFRKGQGSQLKWYYREG